MIFKKVFKKLEKYLYNNDKYENCIYCSEGLIGSQRKFCSDVCNRKYWRDVYSGKVERDKINTQKKDTFENKIRKMKKEELLKTLLKGGLCKKCKKNLAN